jgi:hypothetical protein
MGKRILGVGQDSHIINAGIRLRYFVSRESAEDAAEDSPPDSETEYSNSGSAYRTGMQRFYARWPDWEKRRAELERRAMESGE